MQPSDDTHVYHRQEWKDRQTQWAQRDCVALDSDHELVSELLTRAFGSVEIMTGRDYAPMTCSECLQDIFTRPVRRKDAIYCSGRCAAIAKGRAKLRVVPEQPTLREVIAQQGPHHHRPV